MKIKQMISAFLLLVAAGCGGGGGGGAAPPVPQPEVGRTITGVASKGLVSGGTVSAFRVDGGVKGAQLGQSNQTTSAGRYNITIPSTYSGPVLLEISGGNYQDEVTLATVPLTGTLKAAFNVVAGTTTVKSAITPLTEIATKKMAGNFSDPDTVNAAVSSFYAVGDIITTEPIDINNSTGATPSQKNYSQILAAVSQILSDAKKNDSTATLDSVLSSLVTDNAAVFTSALNTYRATYPAIAASIGSAPSIGGSAPSITTQPADTSVATGGSALFSVVAPGTGLTYQWQVNSGTGFANVSNDSIHSGATTATLSINGATNAMNGYQYRVIVTSSALTTTISNAATLTVVAPSAPVITTQPSNSTVAYGANTSFTVAATGTGLSYQWQVNSGSGFTSITNGGLYSGTTNATLSITGATSAMSGYTYRAVVTSTNGTQTLSDSATLTVAAPTSATLKLTLQNVPSGVSISALQFSFLVPAGVIITTDPNTGSSPNITWIGTSPQPNLTFYNYDSTSHILTGVLLNVSSGFGSGDLIQITAPISPGPVITPGSFPSEATIDVASDVNDHAVVGLKLPITVKLQ